MACLPLSQPLPHSVHSFISKGWPEKNIKFAAKESRSILGKGQKPSVLTVTGNLAGNKWGRLSQLCRSENVLLVGVSGEPAISLTENLGMGEPKKGWAGLATRGGWLGNGGTCAGETQESPVECENCRRLIAGWTSDALLNPRASIRRKWKLYRLLVFEKNICPNLLNLLADH